MLETLSVASDKAEIKALPFSDFDKMLFDAFLAKEVALFTPLPSASNGFLV